MEAATKESRPLFTNQQLCALIVPLLIEQLLAVAVGMADTMMVSQAGEAAVSGVSLVDMINNLIIYLFSALATGGAVVTSQFIGARRIREAGDSAGQLVLLSLLGGLGILAFCLLCGRPVMRLFFGSITEDVMEAGLLYLRITAVSYPFLALYNAGAALFRSVGNSGISMRVSIVMNLINIVGNAIGVLVLHLGVAGVALPTLISRAVAAFLILRAAEHGAGPVQLHLRGLRLRGHMVRRILEIGVPSAVENGLFQLGRLLVVSIIATFGTAQIAANAVANNLDGMAILGGQALGLATITVVGQCVGAGDYAQARRYNRKLMLISWLLIAASAAVILTSLPLLLNLYNISDEARVLSAQLVRLHNIPAIALWCLSFTLPNTLRAAGDARFTMVVSIVSMAVFRIGFSVVLGIWMGMGAIGVWIAMDIDWVCRVICFVARYFSGAWTRKYQNYQA